MRTYIVWERLPGSRYEQPICFDLTKEQAEAIAADCPRCYERSAELSTNEIDAWFKFAKGK